MKEAATTDLSIQCNPSYVLLPCSPASDSYANNSDGTDQRLLGLKKSSPVADNYEMPRST